MSPYKRWRNWAFLVLPLAVIAANAFGPDGWREPLVRCLWLAWSALAIALGYSARKALFDYANGREAWLESLKHPIGAGLSFLGLCILTGLLCLGLLSFAKADTLQTSVPAPAQALAPVVVREIESYWPDMPRRSYLGALVEQETCITLRHASCWNPAARLKTSREEGGGLGQFTRTYAANGALRFDALAEVRAMSPAALSELNWNTVYLRADLGLRAMLIKLRDCDRRVRQLGNFEPVVRVAFCDAAYNGGMAGLQQDRKLCALASACDPRQWFGHVENTSGKSRAKWQGYGKSAFEINREHVLNAVIVRRPKYVAWLGV